MDTVQLKPKKHRFRRMTGLLLALLLALQLLPLDAAAEYVSEDRHSGWLIRFADPSDREAFEAKYGGRTITDTLTLAGNGLRSAGYRKAEGVLSVTPNGYLEAEDYDEVPDDPRFNEQWALTDNYTDIRNRLWINGLRFLADESSEGFALQPAPVKVAVLDSGIDGTHEDLTGRVGSGYDAVSGELLSGSEDSDISPDSHGTMVAGIIAASAYNGKGISGVSGGYPVTLLPVRVLDANGSGTIADVVAGIYWAIENGADIINMSFGKRLSYYPAPLAQAVADAADSGIWVFAASGNDGRTNIENCYPACLKGVHPIGAYEKKGSSYSMCSFSNGSYYLNGDGFYCAPGRDLLTTVKGNDYALFTGTSASCAFFSGYAAVLVSVARGCGGVSISGMESVFENSVRSSGWYAKVLNLSSGRSQWPWMCSDNDLKGSLAFSLSAPQTVFDRERFSVSFSRGAELVSELAFFCTAEEFITGAGCSPVIVKNDGSDPTEYEAELDFSDIASGSCRVFACVKLKTDDSEGDWWSELRWESSSPLRRSAEVAVLRPGPASLLLVRDPDGCTMGSQQLFILDAETGGKLRTLETDPLGYAEIPASCFRNGLVTVECCTREFCYRQTLPQASETELDFRSAEPRSIIVLDEAGLPVSGAEISLLTPSGSLAVGTTDESGSVSLLTDPGEWEFIAVRSGFAGEEEGGFHALLTGTASFDASAHEFVLDAGDACRLTLPELGSEGIESAALSVLLNGERLELSRVKDGPVYLTPGTWDITAGYNFLVGDPRYSYCCRVDCMPGRLTLPAGDMTLPVAPSHLSLRVDWPDPTVRPGGDPSFDYYLVDALGNRCGSWVDLGVSVYDGETLISQSEYGFPNLPLKNARYRAVFRMTDDLHAEYPALFIDSDSVSLDFTYSVDGSFTVRAPEEDERIYFYAFVQQPDGSLKQLNTVGWEDGSAVRFDASMLEPGTPVGIVGSVWMEYNGERHCSLRTAGFTYAGVEADITAENNAVRLLTPEYANAPDWMWPGWYIGLDTAGGVPVAPGYFDRETIENGILVPEDAGHFAFIDSDSGFVILTGSFPAGREDAVLSVDYASAVLRGSWLLPCDTEVTLLADLPGLMSLPYGASGGLELYTNDPDAAFSASFFDTSYYEEEKTSFTVELPFPTDGDYSFVPAPPDRIECRVNRAQADSDTLIDIVLTDANGVRFTDISRYNGWSEEIYDNSGDPLPFTVFLREADTGVWQARTAYGFRQISLGRLPEGAEYEIRAAFDFSGYEPPLHSAMPDDFCGTTVTGPVTRFTVGAAEAGDAPDAPEAPGTDAVPAPASLRAVPSGSGSLTVSGEWTAAPGLSAVLLREGLELTRSASGSVSFTDSGLDAGRIYTYSLVLEDADGRRGSALYASARTTAAPDTEAPTVPGSFRLLPAGDGSVILNWSASTDNDRVKGYVVFRNGEELARVVSRSFTDPAPLRGQANIYTVAALDPSGNLSPETEPLSHDAPDELRIGQLLWKTEGKVGPALTGDTLSVTLMAEEGLENVRAGLLCRDAAGQEFTREIVLSASGEYYYGSIDLENAAELLSLRGFVLSGEETAAEKTVQIGKKRVVKSLTVRLPDGNWNEAADALRLRARLRLSSASASFTQELPLTVSGAVFTDLIPAEDYVLTVSLSGGVTAKQMDLTLLPASVNGLTLSETGLRVLRVRACFDAETPVTNTLWLNGRPLQPDGSGLLRDSGQDTALLLPASERTLRLDARLSYRADGTDWRFAENEIPIRDDCSDYLFTAERLGVSEHSLRLQDGEGSPIPEVEFLITVKLPDGAEVLRLMTTDEAGTLSVLLPEGGSYTAEPRGEYACLPGSDGIASLDGGLYRYSASDPAGTSVPYLRGFESSDSLTLTLTRLVSEEKLSVRLTDCLGQPVSGVRLRLYPAWCTEEDRAVTDEDGNAEFALAQTADLYTVCPENAASNDCRVVHSDSFRVYESRRKSGRVVLPLSESYAPVVSGVRSGELVFLLFSGGPLRSPFSGLTDRSDHRVRAYAPLPAADPEVSYSLLRTNGASNVFLCSDSAAGLLPDIGAMTGVHNAHGTEGITIPDEGCVLTLSSVDPNGSAHTELLRYELASEDRPVVRINASGAFSLQLKPGAVFTVTASDYNGCYVSEPTEVTVPDKASAAVTLPLKETYLDIRLLDENGQFPSSLRKNVWLFGSDFGYLAQNSGTGTLRLSDPGAEGTLTLFARFGEVSLNHSYINLDGTDCCVKLLIDANCFDGRTLTLNAPVPEPDQPAISLGSVGYRSPVTNLSIRTERPEDGDPYYRVSLVYHAPPLADARLLLPEGAENVSADLNAITSYDVVPVEFTLPVSEAGGASLRVMSGSVLLREVLLQPDSFRVYTQSTLSSSEIDFTEISPNKPLIPERGYCRLMEKDAPLLQGGTYAGISASENLNKSWLFFGTTEADFEVSVCIDGIPVNYPYERVDEMRGGNQIMTVFNSISSPGYEPENGRIWQDSMHLKMNGVFDPDTLEGALLLPFPEPESYPHTYEVSAVLRYEDSSEPGGRHEERRTEYVTVYDDTAYLRCYDFTHYDSNTFGQVLEEDSPTYWVRPRTDEERRDYRTRKNYRLDWNNTNLFTFRAYFAKPEEVEAAWAVADVDDSCEFRSFALSYDPDTMLWTGTGQLGSAFCIPDHFGVVYTLKRASAASDFPILDLQDFNAALQPQAKLPEGWTAEDPEPGTNDMSIRLRTETGDELTLRFFLEEDVKIPSEGGYRVGVRDGDGSVYPVRIITEQEAGRVCVSMYGDAALLVPKSGELHSAILGYLKAAYQGVRYGCEIVGTALDIYTKASLVVDTDAAIFDTSEDWVNDLPPDALKEYRDWQDTKAVNDLLDIGLGLVGSLLPPSLIATVAFDCWLFRKTNEVDDIYKEIARKNRRLKEREAEWKRQYPDEYEPELQKYIDPSGYVFEAVEDNRLEGVSASVLRRLKDGSWELWDSESFGEGPNPQTSGEDGVYGWNVSEGRWKVLFEKDGFIPAESTELDVPPAHLDVNIPMVSADAPVPEAVVPAPGGAYVDFTLSRYMLIGDISESAVLIFDGAEIPAELTALDEAATSNGNKRKTDGTLPAEGLSVARSFRLTPLEPLPVGASCLVRFLSPCRAYNGRLLEPQDSGYAVIPPEPEFTTAESLSFLLDGYAMRPDGSLDLSAELVCDGEDFLSRAVWTSLNPQAFSVDGSGVVRTVGGGTGFIRVGVDGLCAVCAVADHVQAGTLTVLAVSALTGETIGYVCMEFEAGEPYAVEPMEIPGYAAAVGTLFGTMPAGDAELTVEYMPTSLFYPVPGSGDAPLFGFLRAVDGRVTLFAAVYDKGGRMLGLSSAEASDPAPGQTLSVSLPELPAEAVSVRFFLCDETGAPLGRDILFELPG